MILALSRLIKEHLATGTRVDRGEALRSVTFAYANFQFKSECDNGDTHLTPVKSFEAGRPPFLNSTFCQFIPTLFPQLFHPGSVLFGDGV